MHDDTRQMISTRPHRPAGCALRRGFTLAELLVTLGIVALLMGIAVMSFRKLNESNSLTTAVSTLTTYAAFARSYAIENEIETMLVVNPFNGRLEIWHLNPAPAGGPWDPLSRGSWGNPAERPYANGYAFELVLGDDVSLPRGADGRPLVVVHPLDFATTVDGSTLLRSRQDDAERRNRDNLNWVAICFDANGRLVQRARRIATRVAVQPWNTLNPRDNRGRLANRRLDGTPDTDRNGTKMTINAQFEYAVDSADTLIASTRGFVVSDRSKFEQAMRTFYDGPERTPLDLPPQSLVNEWLDDVNGNGSQYRDFKRNVLVSQQVSSSGTSAVVQ